MRSVHPESRVQSREVVSPVSPVSRRISPWSHAMRGMRSQSRLLPPRAKKDAREAPSRREHAMRTILGLVRRLKADDAMYRHYVALWVWLQG